MKTKGRGKGTKTAMKHVNLRIPMHVYEFYKENYGVYTSKMRRVLVNHMIKEEKKK